MVSKKVANPEPNYSFSTEEATPGSVTLTQAVPDVYTIATPLQSVSQIQAVREYSYAESVAYIEPFTIDPYDYYNQYVSDDEMFLLSVLIEDADNEYVYSLANYRDARYIDPVVIIPEHLTPYPYLLDPEVPGITPDLAATDEEYVYLIEPVFQPATQELENYADYVGPSYSYEQEGDPYPQFVFDPEVIGIRVVQSDDDPDIYLVDRYAIDQSRIIESPTNSGFYTVDHLVEEPPGLYGFDARFDEYPFNSGLYDLEV